MSERQDADAVRPPFESIQHLLDVFIEGGWAEDEDLPHLDNIHGWLRWEKDTALIDGHAFVPDDLPDQGHPSYTCAICGKRKAEHSDGAAEKSDLQWASDLIRNSTVEIRHNDGRDDGRSDHGDRSDLGHRLGDRETPPPTLIDGQVDG